MRAGNKTPEKRVDLDFHPRKTGDAESSAGRRLIRGVAESVLNSSSKKQI